MTTADYALIVSILSFVVSIASMAWNVWSKFIYPKGRVRVHFAVMVVAGVGKKEEVLRLSATNFGPSDTTLHMVVYRHRKVGWRHLLRDRWGLGILSPLENFPSQSNLSVGPFSGGLPHKLKVGEDFGSFLVADHEVLKLKTKADIGFIDIFGRYHWAPRQQLRQVSNLAEAHPA